MIKLFTKSARFSDFIIQTSQKSSDLVLDIKIRFGNRFISKGVNSKRIQGFTFIFIFLIAGFLGNTSLSEAKSRLETIPVPLYAGGNGSLNDPYQISNWTHLHNIRSNMTSKYFILMNDLTPGTEGYETYASATANGGKGWLPIGNYYGSGIFQGTLDGNHKSITGLTINNPALSGIIYTFQHVGLFGVVMGATIKNLDLRDVSIRADELADDYAVGALIGSADPNVHIENVRILRGSVLGRNNTGGMVGIIKDSPTTVINCFADVTVTGIDNVGGLIGYVISTTISKSAAIGDVTGTGDYVGGLIGGINAAPVSESYATGNVKGETVVGGLIGSIISSNISNSYATGNVEGESLVGGFGGSLSTQNSFVISNSYSKGNVISTGSKGGFYGSLSGSVTFDNLFFDKSITGLDSQGLIEGVSSADLRNKSLFSAFDFTAETGKWIIQQASENDGRYVSNPYLRTHVYDAFGSNVTLNPIPGLEVLYAGGKGTESEPFQISNWKDLHQVRESLTAHFILKNNLDENTTGYTEYASSSANAGKGWLPLGTNSFNFTGKFNGSGYVINNLYLSRTTIQDYSVGLFMTIQNAEIRNLGVVNSYLIGRSNLGIIAGTVYDGILEQVYTSGTVTSIGGYVRVGGLVGVLSGNSIVRNSFSKANVSGITTNGNTIAGGLLGTQSGTVSNSYSTGNVYGVATSNNYVILGGFLGVASGTIENTYSAGKVSGSVDTGSLIIGGYVGFLNDEPTLPTITNSYWNVETSLQENSPAGIGKTTAELKSQASFTDWSFDETTGPWKIMKSDQSSFISYPYLSGIVYDVPRADPIVNPIPGLEQFYFAGGQGTTLNPYQISNWEHLYNIREKPSAFFVLLNDLDASTYGYADYASSSANSNKGWDPMRNGPCLVVDSCDPTICITASFFTGSLDGNGFSIYDLTINRPTEAEVGLFGRTQSGAKILNLNLRNVSVNGAEHVGALVGLDYGTTITKVSVSGTVSGENQIGGIVGLQYGASQLSQVFNTASILGSDNVGGIVGSFAGGGTITNSYNTGQVKAVARAGGIVAIITGGSFISNTYSSGKVFSDVTLNGAEFGGLVGFDFNFGGGAITNSFWDVETSTQATTSGAGAPKTTEEMKTKSTFTSECWDFVSIWGIKELATTDGLYISYPYLLGFEYDVMGAAPSINPLPGLKSSVLPQQITFEEIVEKTYGDATFTLGDSLTDQGLTVSYTATDASIVSIIGNQATILKAGSTIITASQAGTNFFSPANPIARNLVIKKATLVITASSDQNKTYGSLDPELTYLVDGLANGDDAQVLTGSLERELGENTGKYKINQGSLVGSENYEISFTGADFEILKKSLYITASSDQNKTYGLLDPELTYQVDGLANGDDAQVLTGALERELGENTGKYKISQGSLVGSENYEISFTGADFEILKKSLYITASSDQNKTYGSLDPELTYLVDGLANGDDAQVLTGSLERELGENTGKYKISQGSLAGSENYEISFTGADFEILKKSLLILSEGKEKNYGNADPLFTVVFEGFVSGEDQSSLDGELVFERQNGESVGSYQIIPSGLTAKNYKIKFGSSLLQIIKANLRIVATDLQKTYGEEIPTLEYTYVGLVNGDEQVEVLPSISTSADKASSVGSYLIMVSGAEDGNYEISYENASLVILPADLKIQAEFQSKAFGNTDPALSFLATGWKLADDSKLLSGNLSRETGETVGKYAIEIGTMKANANYQIRYQSEIFEILPAEIVSLGSEGLIETAWAISPNLPAQITAITADGQVVKVDVLWDQSNLNVFKRGEYILVGEVKLSSGVLNPQGLASSIVVKVLEKPAPIDLILSSNTFEPDPNTYFQVIGNLLVEDPYDQKHVLSLPTYVIDNQYFEVKNGILFWSSAEEVSGKTEFQILILVEDRDGNILEKSFTIFRKRVSIMELEVFTAFTPDGDGVNDSWGVPDLRYFEGVRLQVFDRNGERLFYTEDPDERWDCTYQGKVMPIGTYYWVVEIKETGETRNGTLTIVKR